MTDVIEVTTPRQPPHDGDDLRARTEALLRAGQRDAAIQAARSLLREQPGPRTWRVLRRLAESDAARAAGLRPYKLALLSSFAVEFLHDPLMAYGFVNGVRLELYQAPYGAFRQELLDPGSRLHTEPADAVLLAVEGEDWVPAAYRPDVHLTEAEWALAREAFRNELASLVAKLRSVTAAPLLVHNFAAPPWRALGILDATSADGQARRVSELNQDMVSVAASALDVYIVDYAGLTQRHGLLNWHDARMRLYARAPIAQPMLAPLAREYLKFIRSLVGYSRKCLVLDLDNTLWGGVIGEDGAEGIALGPTYPGSAYVEFQQHVLALHRRGVILAIASKNNPGDVEEVFAGNRFMLLRKEHFAEVQVHWEIKSESLRRIASSLGIGLEHMVFVDDSPAECEQVRAALPMVTVVQLPAHPEQYVAALHEDGWFDGLALSAEDMRRTELYRQRASAEALRSDAGSVDDYYRALDMELRVAPVDRASLKRAAQLTQKTNQLNATTRRYSEAQIAKLADDPGWVAVTVGVADRFGDNGIVGLLIARAAGDSLDIDTFLLSCRVIGRGVETAMLAYLCDVADERSLRAIVGEVIPTPKNVPVREVYARHGFDKVGEDAAGATRWRMEMQQSRVGWPDWFRVVRGAAKEGAIGCQ